MIIWDNTEEAYKTTGKSLAADKVTVANNAMRVVVSEVGEDKQSAVGIRAYIEVTLD